MLIAPTAYHKVMHPEGAGRTSTTYIISSYTTTPLEDIAEAATHPLWFQMYVREAATKIYAEDLDVQGFEENQEAAAKGGNAAGNARRTFEQDTKRQVISAKNFLKDGDEMKKIE